MRHKIAAEVFGRHIDKFNDPQLMESIKKNGYMSPHTGLPFTKVSRLISYPFAIDVVYWNDVPVIIDPNRFVYEDTIFTDIANTFLGGTNDVIKFSEVKLRGVGSIDYVLAKHQPLSSKIEDIVITEIQSDSTTGTGKLVQNLIDLVEKGYKGLKERYSFGMNTYNTIKLSFIQMLMKGRVAEKWKKHNVWVMQDFVFQNMLKRFDLKLNVFDKEKYIHYFIYSLVMDQSKKELVLKLTSKHSYTADELREAFNKDKDVPSLETFIRKLEARVLLKLEENKK